MILYQPQFTEWTDFKSIEALAAAQFLKTPKANPVFGVIGLKGTTSYDEAGRGRHHGYRRHRLNFSGLGREELTALAVETGKLLPTGPITVSEARVDGKPRRTEAHDRRVGAQGGPAADLRLDVSGDPGADRWRAAYAPVKGKAGLSFVVNTNWDVFRIDEGGALYLRDDTHWLTATAPSGPWTPASELPALLKDLPDDGNWADARGAMPPEPYAGGAMPKVIVTSVPAELILFNGSPRSRTFRGRPAMGLEHASRTSSSTRPASNGTCFCRVAGSAPRR